MSYDIEIDLQDVNLVYDHDGNVHKNDIGQDYLLELLDGMETTEEFVDEVYRYRDGEKDPSDAYITGEDYSRGEELGIMIAEQGLDRAEVLDQVDGNGFREGFPAFLEDSLEAGAQSYIVSAGDQDFLTAFYTEHGFDPGQPGLHIDGTKQRWDGDGEAQGIVRGCGQAKKPERYFTSAATRYISRRRDGQNHPMDPLIVSGDSGGDSELMAYARQNGGLAIATGDSAEDHADVVVEADSWHGQIAATLSYAGLQNGMTTDEIIEEGSDYLEQYDIEDGIAIEPGAYGDREVSINGKHTDIELGATVAELAEAMLE